MSGHSKWNSIKHKKGANDAKRGKILTKHSKLLMVVGRDDPNPETNAALRVAIENAKADSVPKDNIERTLKKLSGADKDAAQFSQQVYECFGPEGVPFMVLALTDNINRTFPSVRMAVEKNGGKMGSSGAVAFLFDHVGVVQMKTAGRSEDEVLELAMDGGADDIVWDEEESEIVTEFSALGAVRDGLQAAGVEVVKAELQYRPKDPKMITDLAVAQRLEKFVEVLEDAEDVDEVFGGFDVDESLMDQLL